MKKKYMLILISVLFLIVLLTILMIKNNKEYIMHDGVILALTLDGKTIKTYPEGRNYGVNINCENGKGKWLVEEWKLAVEEITGNVICNIEFKSNPTTLKSKLEEVNLNNNYDSNGYRYSGTNPNNYIWFNNEMWRIIGSIPVCLSATCGTNTTNLVKIIRKNSIGGLAFDGVSSNYTGTWGENTLYTLLNEYFYGAQDGSSSNYCYGYLATSKSKCNYTTKGINPTGYYGKMVKNVYWNTGSGKSSVTPNNAYGEEMVTRTILGYIGLMGISDYGYAADKTYHTTTLDNYNTKAITSTNWLHDQGAEWLINEYNGSDYTSLFIGDTGVAVHQSIYAKNTRPVVYLDQSVYIISGDGTEGNPYQIGM